MSTLTGEIVRLRVIENEDIPLMKKWFNDPEVTRYLSFYLPVNQIMEEEWVRRVNSRQGGVASQVVFAIEAIDTKGNWKPIGTCGLHEINWKDRLAVIGIAIGEKSYQNNGRGTEALRLIVTYAFQELNLHKLETSVYEGNERSLAIQRKIGFKKEGTRRKAIWKRGEYSDIIILGLLREEWTP